MSKDNLQEAFSNLKNEFDFEEPNINHNQRFLNKLNKVKTIQPTPIRRRSYWKPLAAIAASIVLLITLFVGSQKETIVNDLASVSPEMADTQNFFTLTIAEELSKIEGENSPEAQSLIKDTMVRMNILENEYNTLKTDLEDSGYDKRVIYAMISNFQNRIDLLQSTLETIKTIKQLNNNTNENSTTI